jgi:hypothetical protein
VGAGVVVVVAVVVVVVEGVVAVVVVVVEGVVPRQKHLLPCSLTNLCVTTYKQEIMMNLAVFLYNFLLILLGIFAFTGSMAV